MTEARRGQLVFDGNFESGNLGSVKQLNECEYDIEIAPDTNNARYRVWFYFSVTNARAGQRAIFHITNFSKTKSLYREGMTPVVSSSSRPKWQRISEKNVFYYRCPRNNNNWVMSFLFAFDSETDVFFFAYCYPYTYVSLQKYLCAVDAKRHPFWSREVLCKTLHGYNLDLVTISSPGNTSPQPFFQPKRNVVCITARVHPGESPSSFICQGLMEYLTAHTEEAQTLRDALVFKIVPMLNPDGVEFGNYRCSTMGVDLNRCWLLSEDHWMVPTIAATKKLLLDLHDSPEYNLDFFIDLHAHSTMMNCFMFGNSVADVTELEKALVFPRLLEMNFPDFSFANSRFDSDASKAGTGRRALLDMLTSTHCYTLEVSFFGAKSPIKPQPYNTQHYIDLGRALGATFLDYYQLRDKDKRKQRSSSSPSDHSN
eukprot:GILJ01009514.1.p1 GENE.GILJ01009514.1~~GILJ01009514.1.p1  ORF type:complete len:427 (+),score=70.92 GILJ01009514.1:65-1345(+)